MNIIILRTWGSNNLNFSDLKNPISTKLLENLLWESAMGRDNKEIFMFKVKLFSGWIIAQTIDGSPGFYIWHTFHPHRKRKEDTGT